MSVKDIILKVCDFTENKELYKALTEEGELTPELKELKEQFLKCFNLVNNEIVSEYMPSVKQESIFTSDGKVDFSSLQDRLVNIVSIKSLNGLPLKFEVFDNFLITKKGNIVIKYNAMPKELNFEDEFTSTIPERVYAYGVVKEFYFIQALYEDAKIWDERFKNSIETFLRKKGNTFLPRRRWI